MRILLLIFLIQLPFQVKAQTAVHDGLKKYFTKSHQAAVALCQGNMEVGKILYDEAFKSSKYSYYLDLNNAIYAETQSKRPDTAKIVLYLKQLQAKGICVHEKYKKRTGILPFANLLEEKDCNHVQNNQDRELIKNIIETDQSIRDTLIKARAQNSPNLPKIIHKLYNVDSTNYQIVLNVMKRALKQGIPLQDYIGLEAYYHTLVVILHYSEQRYDAVNIFKMVTEGVLDPRNVLSDFDNSIQRGYIKSSTVAKGCGDFQAFGTTSIIQTFPTIIIRIPPDTCLSKINELRSKYYLQDVIEECKIKAYAQYNYANGFDYPTTSLAVDNEYLNTIEMKILEKYKIIKYKDATDFDYNRK